MLNRYLCVFLVFTLCLLGCQETPKKPKLGVSLGVGIADRWEKEQAFMEERAKELGIDIEVRLNRYDTPKTQTEDCLEMIAGGIDILILTPRNARNTDEILTYAKQKNVKIIAYSRPTIGKHVDLFIGFDCYKIGQSLGQHLIEKMYHGTMIMLKGDKDDLNTPLLYCGAMKYIKPLVERGDLKLILNEYVTGWSKEEAKRLVMKAVTANGNQIDAIFTPNDILAEGSVSALNALNISDKVFITGMDAELGAIRRIVAGTQDVTMFMDLKMLAYAVIDQAYNMAMKKKVSVNAVFENGSDGKIDAYLVNGKLVTKENIDKVLIEPGHYTREEVYSE